MRTVRFAVVDVFTDTPLAGNQLAVFTDARDLDDELMQALARETNFSETVFVLSARDGGHARLRIFTPLRELDFAGHPVLGAAFVLGAPLQLDGMLLEVPAGVVPVHLERDGPRIVSGRMEQPLPQWTPFERPDELLADLGVTRSLLPVERYDVGVRHVYVELASPREVAALDPHLPALARHDTDGISCFARDGGGWKLRMFAPALGVPEDAATGSAAGPLAVHLARHGRVRWGEEVRIAQGAELGRPAALVARAHGEGERVDRVEVGGAAVVVARGEFRLP